MTGAMPFHIPVHVPVHQIHVQIQYHHEFGRPRRFRRLAQWLSIFIYSYIHIFIYPYIYIFITQYHHEFGRSRRFRRLAQRSVLAPSTRVCPSIWALRCAIGKNSPGVHPIAATQSATTPWVPQQTRRIVHRRSCVLPL